MHVTLTRIKTADQPIETAAVVGEEMERWFRDVDGFEGFFMFSRPGETIGFSVWESREAADRYRPMRLQFIERVSNVVGVEVQETLDYQLMFARLGSFAAG